jgi:hypothetical protein
MQSTDLTDRPPQDKRFGGELVLALVTPARNEAIFIEAMIQAVVVETLQPARWIIVSDGRGIQVARADG